MKLTATAALLVLCLASLAPSVFAQAHHHEEAAKGEIADLGELAFESSGSPAAQPHFIRGLLLLHSFEYGRAADAFRKAQEADRNFAMAYWGEAMTHNHTLWDEQDLESARRVQSRLGATDEERLGKAPTAREKAYLEAVHVLFGEGSKKERDAAYEAEMRRIAATWPADLDARAFHALAVLGLDGTERTTGNYMRSASIAEEVYELNRRHPGALHYLIHAYDDPVHAPLGLRAARRYGKVAPAADHALHMPSHIFFALAMWDESIEANVASLAAARRNGAVGTHPLHWLVYAYLQQGRRDDAVPLLRMLADDAKKSPAAPGPRFGLAQSCATWMVETGNDRESPCGGDIDRTGFKAIEPFTGYELARGLAALRRNDLAGARAALDRLRKMVETGRAAITTEPVARRFDRVSQEDVGYAELMTLQLQAAILFADGKRDEALEAAADAVAAERALPYEYGPPRSPKPPAELYADLLLKAGRFDEARKLYDETLQRTPGRALALAPLATAAERTSHPERATEARAQLKKQWRAGKLPGN